MKKIITLLVMLVAATGYGVTETSVWKFVRSDGTQLVYTTEGRTNSIMYFKGTGETQAVKVIYSTGVLQINSTNAQLSVTNQVKLTGNGVAWDDVLASANSAYRSGTDDIDDNPTWGGRLFKDSATTNYGDDYLQFTFQMPHRRKANSDVYPHIHFWQTNATHETNFYMYYNWVTLGGTNTIDIFAGPATNETAFNAQTNAMHQRARFEPISGTGKDISSVLRVRLQRQGSVGLGSITVTDMDVHYQIDGFGSDAESTKSY